MATMTELTRQRELIDRRLGAISDRLAAIDHALERRVSRVAQRTQTAAEILALLRSDPDADIPPAEPGSDYEQEMTKLHDDFDRLHDARRVVDAEIRKLEEAEYRQSLPATRDALARLYRDVITQMKTLGETIRSQRALTDSLRPGDRCGKLEPFTVTGQGQFNPDDQQSNLCRIARRAMDLDILTKDDPVLQGLNIFYKVGR